MSDGFQSSAQQVGEALNEAVVKPVSDEVGRALEQGVQTVVQGPSPIDPGVQQKKQIENQKKLAWAQKVINWYRQIDEDQKRIRQEKQQQQQMQKQEEQQVNQVKQYEAVEKQKKQQQLTDVQQAARKTEIRGGVGG